MPAPYSPLAVANEFIRLAGGGLTHMRLQKLVYYAQGIALAKGFSLTNEQPQVWKYGPVFNGLYYELKYHASDAINAPEAENTFGPAPFVDHNDQKSLDVIKSVWSEYGRYTAAQLSDLTHKPGTPWHILVTRYAGRVPYETDIDKETMRSYFVRESSAQSS